MKDQIRTRHGSMDEELPICLVRVGEFKPTREIVGSDDIIVLYYVLSDILEKNARNHF
jgi:hypothetical protein